MKHLIYLIIILILLPIDVDAGALLTESSLEYQGAFRVPNGNLGGDSTHNPSLARGGAGLTYNVNNNSLIMLGTGQEKLVTEISIPTPKIETNISDLNTSSVVQAPGDVGQGEWDNLNIDGSRVGEGAVASGLLVYEGKLIGSAFPYYSSGDSGHLSHFTAALNWAVVGSPYNFSGFKRVGVNPISSTSSNGGWIGGYMGHVPAEWQARLGAPVLAGNGGIPVITRSSFGPSIWGFDPDDIGLTEIAPAEIFVGYGSNHQTLGGYDVGTGTYRFNLGSNFKGIVFPEGTDSVLVFGRHGLGYERDYIGCYGVGTSDESLHLTPTGVGDHVYCYDPMNNSSGNHTWPYVYQIWAYDANDFLDVKSGSKQYWEIEPYAVWNFTLPYTDEYSTQTGTKSIGGVAYDTVTQRIFISQSQADIPANKDETPPIIHVFHINLDSVSDSLAPNSPNGLSVW